jgi:hypothetical protein
MAFAMFGNANVVTAGARSLKGFRELDDADLNEPLPSIGILLTVGLRLRFYCDLCGTKRNELVSGLGFRFRF